MTIQKLQTLRRQYITLIEMLVVLGILSLVIGLVGFNVRHLVVDQRFRNEVKMVVDQLRMAQNLMLIMDSDIHVKFQEKDGYILMELESSLELPWLKALNPEPKTLNVIHHVGFDEKGKEKMSGFEERGVLDIKFLSGGNVMTSGTLRLATARDSQNALKRFICLSGYPKPIVVQMEFSCPEDEIDQEFKEQLTRMTVQEIQEIGNHLEHGKEGNQHEQSSGS